MLDIIKRLDHQGHWIADVPIEVRLPVDGLRRCRFARSVQRQDDIVKLTVAGVDSQRRLVGSGLYRLESDLHLLLAVLGQHRTADREGGAGDMIYAQVEIIGAIDALHADRLFLLLSGYRLKSRHDTRRDGHFGLRTRVGTSAL